MSLLYFEKDYTAGYLQLLLAYSVLLLAAGCWLLLFYGANFKVKETSKVKANSIANIAIILANIAIILLARWSTMLT